MHRGRSPGAAQRSMPNARDLRKYARLFMRTDRDADGFLTADEATSVFSKSGLASDLLARIWELTDSNRNGVFSFAQFVAAMHFISQAMQTLQAPMSMPNELMVFLGSLHDKPADLAAQGSSRSASAMRSRSPSPAPPLSLSQTPMSQSPGINTLGAQSGFDASSKFGEQSGFDSASKLGDQSGFDTSSGFGDPAGFDSGNSKAKKDKKKKHKEKHDNSGFGADVAFGADSGFGNTGPEASKAPDDWFGSARASEPESRSTKKDTHLGDFGFGTKTTDELDFTSSRKAGHGLELDGRSGASPLGPDSSFSPSLQRRKASPAGGAFSFRAESPGLPEEVDASPRRAPSTRLGLPVAGSRVLGSQRSKSRDATEDKAYEARMQEILGVRGRPGNRTEQELLQQLMDRAFRRPHQDVWASQRSRMSAASRASGKKPEELELLHLLTDKAYDYFPVANKLFLKQQAQEFEQAGRLEGWSSECRSVGLRPKELELLHVLVERVYDQLHPAEREVLIGHVHAIQKLRTPNGGAALGDGGYSPSLGTFSRPRELELLIQLVQQLYEFLPTSTKSIFTDRVRELQWAGRRNNGAFDSRQHNAYAEVGDYASPAMYAMLNVPAPGRHASHVEHSAPRVLPAAAKPFLKSVTPHFPAELVTSASGSPLAPTQQPRRDVLGSGGARYPPLTSQTLHSATLSY